MPPNKEDNMHPSLRVALTVLLIVVLSWPLLFWGKPALSDRREELLATVGLKEPRGVIVYFVEPDSPADKAGLRKGDILVEFNAEPISGQSDMFFRVAETPPGKSISLKVLPISVQVPPGADPFTQIYHLILPSLPLVLVLFGYIARITRAGMIEALESDYTRTAVLKGLAWRTVVFRHVLRNALMPTIAVVATQTGYLIGGLVVIETMFNYQGIGQLLYTSVAQKDFPLIQAGVMTVGVVYLVATLLADISYSLLNPRIRLVGRE